MLRKDVAVMVAAAAVSLCGAAGFALFLEQEQAVQGDVVVGGEEDAQPMPVQPQVNQILSTLGDSKSGAARRRDAAEQKLVDLGANALSHLKAQIGSHKGLAKDALAVAVFRLENAPLAPRELIAGWVSRKTDADPAKVILQRLAADDLRRAFPHHLFYRAEIPGSAAAKGIFPRTVVALAADGKVQAIADDTALATFLKHELPEAKGQTEQRRGMGAAAILALARDMPEGAEVISDGAVSGTSGTGTAWFTGTKGQKVTVAVTLDGNGRVASLVTKPVENGPAQESPKKAVDDEAATAPAESQPAAEIRRRPPFRFRGPLPPATVPDE